VARISRGGGGKTKPPGDPPKSPVPPPFAPEKKNLPPNCFFFGFDRVRARVVEWGGGLGGGGGVNRTAG